MIKRSFLYALIVLTLATVAACAPLPATSPAAPFTSAPPQPTDTAAVPTVAVTPTPEELQGCVPACLTGLIRLGPLPAGDYTTHWFFGKRMVVTLDGQWSDQEDSTGELNLIREGTNNALLFWEDVYPVENNARVDGVPLTKAGLIGWLSADSRLHVTAPVPGNIGANIPASIVDVTIAPGALSDDPHCPTHTCALFFGFPQWTDTWGLADPQVVRLYFADVSYGGVAHVFVVAIYPDKPEDLASFSAEAEPVIASVRVPVHVP